MTRLAHHAGIHALGLHEGRALLSAPQVILKAALEAEREVSLIAGPRLEGFSPIFSTASEDAPALLLRQHALNVIAVPHASRGITLAHRAANSGRAAIALIPNAHLDGCMTALTAAASRPIQNGGSLCVLLEDQPQSDVASCPRQAAIRLGFPCIEPDEVARLRDVIEDALRLSRAGGSPVAIVIHANILRSMRTLEMRPNRVLAPDAREGSFDRIMARRRRRSRWTETRDVMRMARRMELNRARAMPNPGERVPVGFITVGPCDPSIAYVAETLHLHGRVPVLQLGLIHPLDEVAIGRLLNRCERVIVLEPRPMPGAVESAVLAIAEALRKRGERPAGIWGRELPPASEGESLQLRNDESLHPSILARKIVHLLHMIRPTMQIAERLAPEPPAPETRVALRTAEIGSASAMKALRRIASDVDQRLRGQAALLKERGIESTALAIDGIEPPLSSTSALRLVQVEFWTGRTFPEQGIAALRQAARDTRPWIMLVCDLDVPDSQDIERLARGTIPAERTDRVHIRGSNLKDPAALRELLQESALIDRLTIIIVRDGPPAQFDVAAIERTLAEIDRFGFQPRQRLLWPAEQACLFSTPSEEEIIEHQEALGSIRMRTEVSVDRYTKPPGSRVRIRIQPLYEQIDVIRTKPPAWIWRSALHHESGAAGFPRLELPTPIHRRQPIWRAHVAGYRGASPGVAALILCEAGRNMGYDVASVHDPTPIGPARRAWSQIVFTRQRASEKSGEGAIAKRAPEITTPLLALTPYGEVDLLLGFDPHETFRAIISEHALRVGHVQRTTVVANAGMFADEDDRELTPAEEDALRKSLAAISREEHRVIEDFADACRTWFYTDRIADIAMLGVAFQRGLIPVSLEAIEAAVARIEERGFGRSGEAFQFGRHLAVNARLLTRPRTERDDDIDHMIRRMALGIRSGGWHGLPRAKAFEGLVRRSLSAMPGLGETSPGRRAQRDFITAVYRAIEWGGLDYATRYADMLTALYRADRGETGRALTRSAVLPLAEALLIHDPIYIASMATNQEQRRLLRHRLNVKHARGDQIERRYLTRFEMSVMDWRLRAEVRSSDWPARIARAARYVTPHKWRGTRRERDLRTFMLDFVQQATASGKTNYDQWSEAMQRLHHRAIENRLRDMTVAELRMMTEPVATEPLHAQPA